MDSLTPLTLRKMDRVAASRQKSCNACVRGKRKCDKKTPRCTRCAAKGLECVYQKTPPGPSFHDEELGVAGLSAGAATGASTAPGGSGTATNTTTASTTTASTDLGDFDMGFDIDIDSLGNTTTTTSTTSPESLCVPSMTLDSSSLDFSLIDHLMANANATNPSAGAELWNLGGSSGDFAAAAGKTEMPPLPAMQTAVAVRDLSLLNEAGDCLAAFNPLDVHDPRTRVGYIVDFITNMYREFARTRSLPFVHPRLYGSHLPRTMMAAFSAATAYLTRTRENRAWVYKLIADVAREIHREGEKAGLTPVEKIARVQALVILDSIRVFDGDVALRAASEREMPQFLTWMNQLKELTGEMEGGVSPQAGMTRERPPASWEAWVLLESARRTVMMALSFVCLSYILKSMERTLPFPTHSTRHILTPF